MAARIIKCIGFTGQGSQWVGMGKNLIKTFPYTQNIIEEVNSVVGYKLSDIMFDGPEVSIIKLESSIGCSKKYTTQSIGYLYVFCNAIRNIERNL